MPVTEVEETASWRSFQKNWRREWDSNPAHNVVSIT
jgi:hypothetical protein